jgi:tetratricopeptide (TPR) repeat protein
MPTVLVIARQRVPPGLDGVSLLSEILEASAASHRPAYLETTVPRLFGAIELRGLRVDRWLRIEAPRPELYDVQTDPREARNVDAANRAEAQRLDALLRESTGLLAGPPASFPDEATREKLAALGYLGAPPKTPAQAPHDPKDRLVLANSFYDGLRLEAAGNIDAAAEAYRSALGIDSGFPQAKEGLSRCLLQMGRLDESARLNDELMQAGPHPNFYRVKAAIFDKRAQILDALRTIDAGIDRFPEAPSLRKAASRLSMKAGRRHDAVRHMRKAIELEGNSSESLLALAFLLDDTGRSEEAIDAYRAAWLESPRSPIGRDAARALSEKLFDKARFDDSYAALSGALAGDSRDEEVFLNLSLLRVRQGRQPAALQVVLRGLDQFPASSKLHHRAGELLLSLGRRGEALTELRKAVALAPSDAAIRSAFEKAVRTAPARAEGP